MDEVVAEANKLSKTPLVEKQEKKEVPYGILERLRTGSYAEYIRFHQELAETKLKEMQSDGWIVHRKWIEGDGWMAGKVVYAIVETKKRRLFKILWNDNNQEFFSQHESGGAGPLSFDL